jgi:predicted AlkP superfamily pyrophosphatase or phosphodiesterase
MNFFRPLKMKSRAVRSLLSTAFFFVLASFFLLPISWAAPKIVLISLDGATPRIVNDLLRRGILPRDRGIGWLRSHGFFAEQNIVVAPSLTAVSHIAIATGSSAARNDVVSNSFHLLASPFNSNISGFSAPIGGYSIEGPSATPSATAFPVWHALRAAGKTVVTATFPGGDGLDIPVPGIASGSPILQTSDLRTVDYTVPFGEFGGVGSRGFALTTSDFTAAPAFMTSQLTAAGKVSYSPVLQKKTPLEVFAAGGVSYTIQVAALDTTNDAITNYDTLVFFDSANGISPDPFTLPSTGPAYVKFSDRRSTRFYLEGSSKKAGCAFYVSALAPDLSSVHIARYAAHEIPPTSRVRAEVDDISQHVGFWAAQPDYRLLRRISPGLADFSDPELETILDDQAATFADYQTKIALRAIERNPNADLVMVYIEQPDGLEHQFLLTDRRQASNPLDPRSIGSSQDAAKVSRYSKHIASAYRTANEAVARIIEAVTDTSGKLQSDVIVVSDHGFNPFHTSVSAGNLLAAAGIPDTKVRAVTSEAAVHFYINLMGREPGGTVTPAEFVTLQQQVLRLIRQLSDTNPRYAGKHPVPVFDKVYARPLPGNLNDASFGRGTGEFIGQDSGDVFAMLTPGYNFDGAQKPLVQRLGDPASTAPILSIPNFYGAHGYDPEIKHMSAILFAAGPDIRRGKAKVVHNIDIAPTIDRMLGVKPDSTVQGKAIDGLFGKER